jgi:hypothetical protein
VVSFATGVKARTTLLPCSPFFHNCCLGSPSRQAFFRSNPTLEHSPPWSSQLLSATRSGMMNVSYFSQSLLSICTIHYASVHPIVLPYARVILMNSVLPDPHSDSFVVGKCQSYNRWIVTAVSVSNLFDDLSCLTWCVFPLFGHLTSVSRRVVTEGKRIFLNPLHRFESAGRFAKFVLRSHHKTKCS